jgi:hypothetical protein
MDRNNTSFPLKLLNKLKSLDFNNDVDFLKYYQKLTKFYIEQDIIGSRGLLIDYEMGLGNTYTAIAIAEELKTKYDIIILLSKSLKSNFYNSIQAYREKVNIKGRDIDTDYSFVSINASNMIEQLTKSVFKADYNKKIGKLIKLENLEDKVLIVDEAHNFFRSIVNNTESNASKLYRIIMRTKNIKLLFLTGTPIAKDPFELVACFNMLSGRILLPDDYFRFREIFIDEVSSENKLPKLKNKHIYQNRIYGLISYYHKRDETQFPKQLPIKIERIKMSKDQYSKYSIARIKEIEDSKNSFTNNRLITMQKPKSLGSSYRIASRQISNYIDLTADTLNLDKQSPKIKKILDNIKSNRGTHGIYSQFIKSGLDIIIRALVIDGYKLYKPDMKVEKIELDKMKRKKLFAMISGDVKQEIRDNILSVFNSPENKNGEIISIFLISSAGAEGLDFKNMRNIHILEPYWTYNRIQQVFSRAIRFKSHMDLPEKERYVQPFIYLAINPYDSTIESESTDEDIYNRSIREYELIKQFNEANQEVSIECMIFETNCKTCQPTDKLLFREDIDMDLKRDDPCQKHSENKVKVKSIVIEGKKYFYKKSDVIGYDVYEFNEELNGNVEVDKSSEIYDIVISKIKK